MRAEFVIHPLMVCILSVLAAGCNEQRTLVSGLVKLDGKPLQLSPSQRGTVIFHPVAGGAMSTGAVRPDGSYEVSTGGTFGVEQTGDHRVSVRVVEVIAPSEPGREPTGRPLTPALYANPASSGLRFDLEVGANECDLELRSDAGPVEAASAPKSEVPESGDEDVGDANQVLDETHGGDELAE
jgi:hypothetical protein